jgi:aspartyl/glutamyl-tRNA(Asn/Gln) amidotransferase C subunit
MMILKQHVEHMAKLSRLELTDQDKEKLAKEFSDILGYVEKLNLVDTSKVKAGRAYLVDPALSTDSTGSQQDSSGRASSERVNKLRQDEITREEGKKIRDKFISLAPEHTEEFIKTISPLK